MPCVDRNRGAPCRAASQIFLVKTINLTARYIVTVRDFPGHVLIYSRTGQVASCSWDIDACGKLKFPFSRVMSMAQQYGVHGFIDHDHEE